MRMSQWESTGSRALESRDGRRDHRVVIDRWGDELNIDEGGSCRSQAWATRVDDGLRGRVWHERGWCHGYVWSHKARSQAGPGA